MPREYLIELEISGHTALWDRPDCGNTRGTYPAPPRSAAIGMLESILRLDNAQIEPIEVRICSPVVEWPYTTNYGGWLRKTAQISGDNNHQIFATVLMNPCYQIRAVVRSKASLRGTNGAHAYHDMFHRRLRRGRFHHPVYLGWREFLADYVGPFRPETRACESVNLVLPSLLHEVVHIPGKPVAFRFRKNVVIERGVLRYAE